MPRRRRFKPRIDCVAILGKLSSYSSLYHYVYNPPQTPPFEKEGLCCKPAAYLTFKVSLLCIYLGALFKSIFFVTAYINHDREEGDYNAVRMVHFLCYILYNGEKFATFVWRMRCI